MEPKIGIGVLLAFVLLIDISFAVTLFPGKLGGTLGVRSTGAMGKGFGLTSPPFLSSPGESLDFTYYDLQQNCSIGRMIVQDTIGSGGLHVCYLKAINPTLIPRNVAYQFNARGGLGWTGELDANTARSGQGNIDVLSDGRAVLVFSQAGGSGIRIVVAVDASRGSGAFIVTNLDTITYPPGSGAPIWPKLAVGPTDWIHVTACSQTNNSLYYSRWAPGDTIARWVALDSTVNSLSNAVFASLTSGKVAVAYTKPRPSSPNGLVNMDLWVRESTDHGLTWGPKTDVTNYQNADTVRAYCDVSGVYDQSDSMHLVWTGERVLNDSVYYNASAIFHWSRAAGISLESGMVPPWAKWPGTFWWDQDNPKGGFRLGCDRPSLSLDAQGRLYCLWTGQIVPTDTAANGIPNGDLYGRGSLDQGKTWGAFGRTDTMVYVTNSHTPGAPAGSCDDDDYPSITKLTTDSVRVLWLDVRDAGGISALSPVMYLGVKADWFWPGTGVEERPVSLLAPSASPLTAFPNPFTSFVTLPGHASEHFNLYDISGRKVGTYKGSRIGEGLAPGVYFVRGQAPNSKPLRIVKVR